MSVVTQDMELRTQAIFAIKPRTFRYYPHIGHGRFIRRQSPLDPTVAFGFVSSVQIRKADGLHLCTEKRQLNVDKGSVVMGKAWYAARHSQARRRKSA